MVTVITMIALFFVAVALAVEVCITSWSIRRASRYRGQRDSFAERAENAVENFNSLNKYATDISWLLRFIYKHYDQLSDLEKKLDNDLSDEDRKEFKRAIKLVKVTVRASERIEESMGMIASQIQAIEEELDAATEDDEKQDTSTDSKPETPPENTAQDDNSQNKE